MKFKVTKKYQTKDIVSNFKPIFSISVIEEFSPFIYQQFEVFKIALKEKLSDVKDLYDKKFDADTFIRSLELRHEVTQKGGVKYTIVITNSGLEGYSPKIVARLLEHGSSVSVSKPLWTKHWGVVGIRLRDMLNNEFLPILVKNSNSMNRG